MHLTTFNTNKKINKTRLALLSDLHYYSNYPQKYFNKLLNQVKEGHPDYILILGDTIDSAGESNLEPLRSFLTELSNIAPTEAIIGNHELKKGYLRHWKAFANQDYIDILNNTNNINFLNDKSFIHNNINFYGFNLTFHHYEVVDEDYESFCEEVSKLSPKFDNDTYNILLFHSPQNIYRFLKDNPNHELNKADLILCGHTHNGLLHYTFTNFINKVFKTTRSFINPQMQLFPKYTQGKNYERDGYTFEGLTKLSKSTRKLAIFDKLYPKNIGFIDIIPNEKN